MSERRFRWRSRCTGRLRHDLVSNIGHERCVLPLGGERVVRGDDRPAVSMAANAGSSGVDHRLDGEYHARLRLVSRPGASVMQHLRLVVKLLAMFMAVEFVRYGE